MQKIFITLSKSYSIVCTDNEVKNLKAFKNYCKEIFTSLTNNRTAFRFNFFSISRFAVENRIRCQRICKADICFIKKHIFKPTKSKLQPICTFCDAIEFFFHHPAFAVTQESGNSTCYWFRWSVCLITFFMNILMFLLPNIPFHSTQRHLHPSAIGSY